MRSEENNSPSTTARWSATHGSSAGNFSTPAATTPRPNELPPSACGISTKTTIDPYRCRRPTTCLWLPGRADGRLGRWRYPAVASPDRLGRRGLSVAAIVVAHDVSAVVALSRSGRGGGVAVSWARGGPRRFVQGGRATRPARDQADRDPGCPYPRRAAGGVLGRAQAAGRDRQQSIRAAAHRHRRRLGAICPAGTPLALPPSR